MNDDEADDYEMDDDESYTRYLGEDSSDDEEPWWRSGYDFDEWTDAMQALQKGAQNE